MKRIILVILIIAFYFEGNAQKQLEGRVVDSTNTGIEFVTIALLNQKDSSVIQSVLTDAKGNFSLNSLNSGTYLLKAFFVGYKDLYRIIELNEETKTLPTLTLSIAGVNLNEVTVSTLKKLVEFRNGNVTVNIEDSPLAAGNSAWDLLIRLPGVTVDENKNIAIQGKSGVKIMVDDRLQQLSGKQLENLLRSMNASHIQKIEVLKNPPVKYDAEGTAGMINIRTKRVKVYGSSGSIDYTYSQGFYGNHYGTVSYNYKGKNIIFYSSLSPEKETYYNDHRMLSKLKGDSGVTEVDQRMDHFNGSKVCEGNLGLDWLVNKNNTVGVKIDMNLGNGFEKNNGTTVINNNDLGYERSRYATYISNPWDYLNFNMNGEHNFDTLGSKLNFSADYNSLFDLYPGTYGNWFYNSDGTSVLEPYYYLNNHTIKGDVYSSKLDYIKKTKQGIIFEAGLKGTQTVFESRYNFQNKDNSTGEFIVDPAFTNTFHYKEQLAAGYVNFTKEWKKFILQTGCRGENTHIEGYDAKKTIRFTRDYFNLFPAVNLSYTNGGNHELQLSYNRRIERPDYGNLTPFMYRVSLLQAYQGNVNLQPEYSNAFELSHTYAGALSNSFTYMLVDNYSMDYTLANDSSKAIIATVSNLKKAQAMSYNLFFEGGLTKWWNLNFNGSASYLICSGNLMEQPYRSQGYFYMGSLTNEFLIKGTRLEVNARYIGPRFNGIWYNQPRWGIYLAVKRSFFKEKLSVVLGADDIFFTMIGRNQLKYQNQDWYISSTTDSRRFKISLSYNFGKVKVQQREVSSNDEEKGRMGR